MYTLSKLKATNLSYDGVHEVTQKEVEIVNEAIQAILKSRSNTPQNGDIVIYTTKYGDYYDGAHIGRINNGQCYICESPYIPFVSIKGGLGISCSGGAWEYIPANIEFVGKALKEFNAWGRHGACGDGAVMFEAQVNVWRYSEPDPLYPYTTKDYEKVYVYVQEGENVKYKYNTNGCAWETDEDFNAWLKCFNGKVFNGHSDLQKVVFAYRGLSMMLSLDEYNKIEADVEDTTMVNGIRPCKRVYNHEEHTVYTYSSWDLETLPFGTKQYEYFRK